VVPLLDQASAITLLESCTTLPGFNGESEAQKSRKSGASSLFLMDRATEHETAFSLVEATEHETAFSLVEALSPLGAMM
jgi:hypothetical protein